MKLMTKIAAATLIAANTFAFSVQAAAVEGNYLRKGKQTIVVALRDGKLFCTRKSDGFEMCHGMTEQPDGTWTGRNMRHPAFKFMKFRGTVTFTATGLNIKGCALGICKAENWTK